MWEVECCRSTTEQQRSCFQLIMDYSFTASSLQIPSQITVNLSLSTFLLLYKLKQNSNGSFHVSFLCPMSCFSPPLQGLASCTVHEQRSFERKAEEDDGKVSLWMAGCLFFSFASVSSQPALWFERQPSTRVGVQAVGTVICLPGFLCCT